MFFSNICDIIEALSRKEVGNEQPTFINEKRKKDYMKEKLETIRKQITGPMEKLSIIVDEIVYESENGYNFLKITLDRVNGLDMDAIVEATNVINPIVDELDLIDEEYILDISSKERGN